MKQVHNDGMKKGDTKNAIFFGGKERVPGVRSVSDMKDVIYDQEWLKENQAQPLYYMYRFLAENDSDAEKIKLSDLRYDILDSVPVVLGKEYNKTAGHYHSVKKGIDLTYPEIYELIKGEMYYLMQKVEGSKVIDVYVIRASSGDKVIIPPNYGHFSIFLSTGSVRESNWSPNSDDAQSYYDEVKNMHGAAYYALVDENAVDGVRWVKNENYSEVPPLRFLKPTNFSDIGLIKDVNMYTLVNSLEKLDYLNNPQKYPELWKRVLENK